MSKIKEIKVEWHPKTLKGISQIPKDGMEFAYVSEDYKQVHQLVWCKDFMQDATFGFLNNSRFEIYGFEYDPKKDPSICTNKTRIMICNWRDQEFEQKLLKNCQEFLHGLESQMKMRKTTFQKCINPPPIYRRSGVFVLEGSSRWMSAPPMISLYTLMIRIGMVHPLGQSSSETLSQINQEELKPYNWKPDEEGKYGKVHHENDSDHLQGGWSGLETILKHGDRRIFHKSINENYSEEVGIFRIHDDCGLNGFSSGSTEDDFPYWHRKLKGVK
jgi:hypothetical protein